MLLNQRFYSILSRNNPYLTANTMQKSITCFFKAVTPKKEEKEVTVTNQPAEDDDDKEQQLPKRDVKAPKKRVLESDDDDDNQEEIDVEKVDEIRENKDKIPPATNKRVAVESADSPTPVKAPNGGDKAPDGGDKAPDGGDKPPVEVKPVSSVMSAMPTPISGSPLLSVEALIKKKISSGSQALHENIGVTWFKALQPEFDKPYFKRLSAFIEQQRKSKTVFPPADQVFTWTHYHAIRDTRVVIIGQDPYHGPRQAHGLSFSVQRGVAIPKSLQNIYKELANDIPNFKAPPHGNLVGWAKQGVLMLNACLTVNQGEANSHQGKGWENFTDAVILWLSKNTNHNLVFLLWGRFAQKKSALIAKRHKILTSAHPSPLSADNGFFGCQHFSKTNEYLRSQGLPEIDWTSL